MLAEIILFLLLGILAGTLTGLIPGIHINLIGILLISISSFIFAKLDILYAVVFIVAMSITHTFIDFIPSIFLGCPDTDTELSVLPGHQLLKLGKGHEAVMLSAYGSIAAIFLLIIIAFPSTIIFPKIYELTKNIIPFLLIFASIVLILIENKKSKSILAFILTGVLGLIVLNLETLHQPLLPLLTGLFGSSMILTSIHNKTEIPKQNIEKIKLKKSFLKKPLIGSLIASPICSFFPGLGSGQAAIIGNLISKTEQKGFIVLLGATNTLVMGFSFITLYLLSKTRTGSALVIKELIGTPSKEILIIILAVILISGIISFYLTSAVSKYFSRKIDKFDYKKISIGVLILLSIVIFLVSGFFGFIILIISTFTGIYCINLGVRKTLMMGCLLIPTIFIYLV